MLLKMILIKNIFSFYNVCYIKKDTVISTCKFKLLKKLNIFRIQDMESYVKIQM